MVEDDEENTKTDRSIVTLLKKKPSKKKQITKVNFLDYKTVSVQKALRRANIKYIWEKHKSM